MKHLEKITAEGHENILCNHPTTIEITKDNYLTKRGDCIMGINSSKSCFDLNYTFKEIIRKGQKVDVLLKLNNLSDYFCGYGDPNLTLKDNRDIVFRKSDYICNRTLLINCTKAAQDLNRNLINQLKKSKGKLYIFLKINNE